MEQYGSESEACIFNSITPVSPPSELGVFMTKPQSLVQVSSHMEQYGSDSEACIFNPITPVSPPSELVRL